MDYERITVVGDDKWVCVTLFVPLAFHFHDLCCKHIDLQGFICMK